MPLDRNALAAGIKTVMSQANAEKWTADKVADGLADAIHAYASAAKVVGVTGNTAGVPFTQSGSGKLE